MRIFAPLAAAYVGLVILANWLASTYIVHVPLTPYMAPAGVFAIGGILVLRGLTAGVALSATVGLALDSYIFLTIAFGSLAFLPGQIAGKAEMVAVGVALTAARRAKFPVVKPA